MGKKRRLHDLHTLDSEVTIVKHHSSRIYSVKLISLTNKVEMDSVLCNAKTALLLMKPNLKTWTPLLLTAATHHSRASLFLTENEREN